METVRVTFDSHPENTAKSDIPSTARPAIRNLADRFSLGGVSSFSLFPRGLSIPRGKLN